MSKGGEAEEREKDRVRKAKARRISLARRTSELIVFIIAIWVVYLAAVGVITLNWIVANWIPLLSIFLLLVAASFVFGRFWCGWLCPLGAFSDSVVGILQRANKFPSWAEKRVWCRYFCPVGAFWSKFNKVSLLVLKRDRNTCTPMMCPLLEQKRGCMNECPVGNDVLDERFRGYRCIRCLTCLTACDPLALSTSWVWKKG